MSQSIRHLALTLVALRSRRLSWCYLVLALPIVFLAMGAYAYGDFVPYSILAVIVIGQFLYPTLLGWSVTALFYAVAAALYAFVLVRDIVYLSIGRRPEALFGPDDWVAVPVLVAVLAALFALAIKIRPALRNP